MDELLILGGLLLVVGGLTWLIRQAFSVSLFWGVGSLLPPVTLLFILLKWRKASSPVTLAALGCIPVIVGLAMLANRDGERLDAVLRLSGLKAEAAMQPTSKLGIHLHGELDGQPFRPQEGELVGNVLTLREHDIAPAQRELRIYLPSVSRGPLRINVSPEDHGQLPLIEINRASSSLAQPNTRRFVQGYTLHLDLEPQVPNLLVGNFHLVLPKQFGTSLSGRVELFADRLRHNNGKVNFHFDSEDTLAYVIKDSLRRRFATSAVQLYRLSRTSLPAKHLEVDIEALIDGKPQHFLMKLNKDQLRGWQVEEAPFLELPANSDRQAGAVSAPRTVDKKQGFSLQRLQSNPADFQQSRMRIVTVQGGIADGAFVGVDEEGYLVLQRHLGGGGTASYRLSPQSIRSVELLQP